MGNKIEQSYQLARERYACIGVDVEHALKQLATTVNFEIGRAHV